MTSVYSVPDQLISSAPGSAPGVGSGPDSFRHFLIGEQPDEPWEDAPMMKAQIPHCYLLSLANSVFCLPLISHVCTSPPCPPSRKVCAQFLKCSTSCHVSGPLYVLFPQPQRLFFLPAPLSVTPSGKPFLRILPGLTLVPYNIESSYSSFIICVFLLPLL